jgi:hypothetical protein
VRPEGFEMAKKNSRESKNPVVVALKYIYGPLVAKSAPLPPPLAYGIPILVTILLIAVLSATALKTPIPASIIWLLALATVAPLGGYVATLFLVRRSSALPEEQAQAPWGEIVSPKSRQIVERTIECTGSVKDIPAGAHLWLTVDERQFIWPKEGEIIPNKQGDWKGRIFEDGDAGEFSISLFMADSFGDQFIRNWLTVGKQTEYTPLRGIPGTTRITRIEGLRIERKS